MPAVAVVNPASRGEAPVPNFGIDMSGASRRRDARLALRWLYPQWHAEFRHHYGPDVHATHEAMQSVLLQDFVTARAAGAQNVVQSASSWLDLGDLEDVTIFTDVREASTSTQAVQMHIETAAAAQETAFVALLPPFNVVTGLRTDVVTTYLAKIPPARYLRWRLTGPRTGTGGATFRIWVAGYGWA